MGKFIGLLQRLTVTALFVVCTLASSPVLAIAPVLDLDADDSKVIGFGYFTHLDLYSHTATITDNDVLITDSDSNKISRAVITIINPEPGDRLDQNDLEGQLTYDPSSTDTQLIVMGAGPLEKYETALRSITFTNHDFALGLRLISVIVEDVTGQSSNTAVTAIEVTIGGPAWPRGYIYAAIRNAVSTVTLSGATVSLSDGLFVSLNVEESADLYILNVAATQPGEAYTVHASLPGYEANSVENVIASYSNDPSNPILIYLNPSIADADVVPDGQLNAGDFVVATRIVLGQKTATTEELGHGDMNGDGEINLSDLILILQAIQSTP